LDLGFQFPQEISRQNRLVVSPHFHFQFELHQPINDLLGAMFIRKCVGLNAITDYCRTAGKGESLLSFLSEVGSWKLAIAVRV